MLAAVFAGLFDQSAKMFVARKAGVIAITREMPHQDLAVHEGKMHLGASLDTELLVLTAARNAALQTCS